MNLLAFVWQPFNSLQVLISDKMHQFDWSMSCDVIIILAHPSTAVQACLLLTTIQNPTNNYSLVNVRNTRVDTSR